MSENVGKDVTRPSVQISSDAAAVSGPTSDEEIYCPICNYNLTGILTGRCPECGSLFDREALLSNQTANRITLIPWDDPAETLFWPRFRRTLAISLFDSKRFAFAFSVQPQKTRALSFLTWVIFAVSIMMPLLFCCCLPIYWAFPRWEFRDLDAVDVVTLLISIAAFAPISILITTLLATLVLGVFCPHFDGKRHLLPWLAIISYASAHYVLIPMGLPVFILLLIWCRGMILIGFFASVFVVWLACGLLNAFTLDAVVRHRGAGSSHRALAMVAVYLLYLLAPVFVQGVIVVTVLALLQ